MTHAQAKKKHRFDIVTQRAIPILTIGGQILISLKLPEWGLIVSLCAQPFRLYSSRKSYKKAGQAGMFVNLLIYITIVAIGVINYRFLS